MKQTRPQFTHDSLLVEVRKSFSQSLKRYKIKEAPNFNYFNLDCLMSGLAIFTFKYPSLLQFDALRTAEEQRRKNLKQLFGLNTLPCDTQMRTRLDEIPWQVCRLAFTRLFTLLQRGSVFEHFQFLEKRYLVSIDGTGVFSSHKVRCSHCCVKNHQNGTKTYHHQVMGAAMVHPDEKVVYPFDAKPILKSDGEKKNDCERRAVTRWIESFKREHSSLKVTILADGLHSNGPFIDLLRSHGMNFIIVYKESDHKYLSKWIESADSIDVFQKEETVNGV